MHRTYLQADKTLEVPLEDAARDWFDSIYLPLIRIINHSDLLKNFPSRTEADLYAYITYHQWGNWKKMKTDMDIDLVIAENMEEFRKNMAERENPQYNEMNRKITAFVLLNVGTKRENSIIERLFNLTEVEEVHSVHGSIDILVKIILTRDLVSSDAEVIGGFVQSKIRQIPGIISSQTLIPSLSKVKET